MGKAVRRVEVVVERGEEERGEEAKRAGCPCRGGEEVKVEYIEGAGTTSDIGRREEEKEGKWKMKKKKK